MILSRAFGDNTEFGRIDIVVNNAAHQATIDSIERSIGPHDADQPLRDVLPL